MLPGPGANATASSRTRLLLSMAWSELVPLWHPHALIIAVLLIRETVAGQVKQLQETSAAVQDVQASIFNLTVSSQDRHQMDDRQYV